MARLRTTSMPSISTPMLKQFKGTGRLYVNGRPAADIDMSRKEKTLRVRYSVRRKGTIEASIDETVDLEETACHFGGARIWFSCPKCGARCGVIYLGHMVACRKCQRLLYPCSADRRQRGWSLYHRWHMERKPKRMRWKTFHKRNAKADKIASDILLPFISKMEKKLYG